MIFHNILLLPSHYYCYDFPCSSYSLHNFSCPLLLLLLLVHNFLSSSSSCLVLVLLLIIIFLLLFIWGIPKQPMKLQQPRNYDFGMFQFNLLGSQGGNSHEMTTSPPRHTGERQQLHSQQPPNYNNSEPTTVE